MQNPSSSYANAVAVRSEHLYSHEQVYVLTFALELNFEFKMFDVGDLLGGIVNTEEIDDVDFNPSGLSETTKVSNGSGHIMGEVLLWGLTDSGLSNSGPCDLWGEASNWSYAQEPKMDFWVQAVRKPRKGSCFDYSDGGMRSAPRKGFLYAKSEKDGDIKETTEYSPQNFIKVGSIRFKGDYKKSAKDNPLRQGLISDEIDAVISIDVKKSKLKGAIYNATDWMEKLDGNSGMPTADDFKSAYKDDIIGSLKLNKKSFFKADVENFKGINGLLGADVFGSA